MEIPRHWRLKEQRIGFKGLILNPVRLFGMLGAIDQSVTSQRKELTDGNESLRSTLRKMESVEKLKPPVKLGEKIIFSSSK